MADARVAAIDATAWLQDLTEFARPANPGMNFGFEQSDYGCISRTFFGLDGAPALIFWQNVIAR